MLKLIQRFASSPFSGYALIALVVAGAGAGYWFWSELKEFGSLEAKNQSQEQTIQDQALQLATLNEQLQKKQQVNTQLTNQMAVIRRSFGEARQRIQDAEANADKALKQCMDMHIARGMSIGPSREDVEPES